MTWASWTTRGIYSGHGGVLTEEVGPLSGDLTVHTTWADDTAQITVQYTGAADWFTMSGSPVPCCSEEDSRALHEAVVEAVRLGSAATVPASLAAPDRRTGETAAE
ncbi:hypothetical protein [Streptomyces brevispora]|uniref:Uncharacterized protein n=1 Tax=Streptomyces brevispora TaxID=887462 RepID=A0A561TUF3_9ACTN|nr:hypothetical protein [Streptomyces brevispora]TWF90733.1 hypothetical protein FHX80_13149 [Streptomyces brevispora]WSC11718.1 hypothetical protein OIE64_01750 [Streptomyces brevispora]